jgi:hypothetical protein
MEVIYIAGDQIHYVYFPIGGLMSLLSTTETGSTLETATVDNEGIAGLPVILKNSMNPTRSLFKLKPTLTGSKQEDFQEEFDKGEALRELILRYVNVLIAHLAVISVASFSHY